MTDIARLPCIKCGAELESAIQGMVNQPYKGTAFHTYGHYGSTLFDEFGPNMRYLEIVVCDDCLAIESDKGNVLLYTPGLVERAPSKIETWDHTLEDQ